MFNVTINVSFRSEPQQVAPQETTFRVKKVKKNTCIIALNQK